MAALPVSKTTRRRRKPSSRSLCWVSLLTTSLIMKNCCQTEALHLRAHPSTAAKTNMPFQRRSFFNKSALGVIALVTLFPSISNAFSVQQDRLSASMAIRSSAQDELSATAVGSSIAYKAFSVPLPDFPNTNVPVACWFPVDESSAAAASHETRYQHRISVRRIGQLLPNWDFIPDFVAKDFSLQPSASVVDGRGMMVPSGKPTLLLAHGFLGSRFDLSHLAEDLASQGYVCIAPEYPESLSASYERQPGLDRRAINQELLTTLQGTMGVKGRSYGVIGHSLGCGTVAEVGDESWARVSIAGYPRTRDGAPLPGNGLQIASLNDGLLRMRDASAKDYTDAKYTLVSESPGGKPLPRRAAFVLDRPDGPNHISFLCEGVNDSMIEFLSPLLPIAKVLNIPVLDFDRYQDSRDSKATAKVVFPVIRQYLQQEMQ